MLLFLTFFSGYLVESISVHFSIVCVCHCLSNHSLTLPFITLEGDRWWITRTFDSSSVQQEFDWPSCKPLFYHLSVRYVLIFAIVRSCSFVWQRLFCFQFGSWDFPSKHTWLGYSCHFRSRQIKFWRFFS